MAWRLEIDREHFMRVWLLKCNENVIVVVNITSHFLHAYFNDVWNSFFSQNPWMMHSLAELRNTILYGYYIFIFAVFFNKRVCIRFSFQQSLSLSRYFQRLFMPRKPLSLSPWPRQKLGGKFVAKRFFALYWVFVSSMLEKCGSVSYPSNYHTLKSKNTFKDWIWEFTY